MNYDGQLEIAVGRSAESKKWQNKTYSWSELVQKLSEEYRTNETYKEYIASSKQDQLRIKDVGGYVGGYLRGGRRKKENLVHRQLITLDADFAHGEFWEDVTLQFHNAAILHSTHKHHEHSPRFRLVMPLDREVTPDEYVAISRRIAGTLGIELFDSTTFEIHRLMFWPSNPKDVDYYFRFQDGPFLSADEVLESYTDWKDSSLWPTSNKQIDGLRTNASRQEDPENKKGIVGAFCRTYGIHAAIENFLSDSYSKTDDENRYTYKNGTTASGLIVYEDKFAFSHHGTDPISGKLCNSFDLVRIHKYGHLDPDNTEESGVRLKSFKAMEEFAREDKKVRLILASENLALVKYEFAEEDSYEQLEDEENLDWMKDLDVDGRGRYLSTSTNLNLIFDNDSRFKGVFRLNRFDNKNYVCSNMPWRRVPKPETIRNVDYSGIRNYIESIYGISGNTKVDDALNLQFEKNSFHPIQEYLKNLKWDGKPRIETTLIDYFGAEDNVYTREALKKTLVAGVTRAFKPGTTYQMVMVLVGGQGCGKSTFARKLGKNWFSDTFTTVHGKEAFEQVQGAWVIEIAELAGLRKAEVETTKHFIAKSEDTFRPAYGRTTETYYRQCVFIGTTNKKTFLNDPSGNRRWNPIQVETERVSKSVWEDLTENEVDQLWAEAVDLYRKGERLTLSPEASEIAAREQRNHSEADERRGIIEKYLDTMLPNDWDERDIYERRNFFEDKLSPKGTVFRDSVCIAEIWCECLGKNREDMDRYKTRELNDIMRSLEEWEESKSTANFPLYGKQKFYLRKLM